MDNCGYHKLRRRLRGQVTHIRYKMGGPLILVHDSQKIHLATSTHLISCLSRLENSSVISTYLSKYVTDM